MVADFSFHKEKIWMGPFTQRAEDLNKPVFIGSYALGGWPLKEGGILIFVLLGNWFVMKKHKDSRETFNNLLLL